MIHLALKSIYSIHTHFITLSLLMGIFPPTALHILRTEIIPLARKMQAHFHLKTYSWSTLNFILISLLRERKKPRCLKSRNSKINSNLPQLEWSPTTSRNKSLSLKVNKPTKKYHNSKKCRNSSQDSLITKAGRSYKWVSYCLKSSKILSYLTQLRILK